MPTVQAVAQVGQVTSENLTERAPIPVPAVNDLNGADLSDALCVTWTRTSCPESVPDVVMTKPFAVPV